VFALRLKPALRDKIIVMDPLRQADFLGLLKMAQSAEMMIRSRPAPTAPKKQSSSAPERSGQQKPEGPCEYCGHPHHHVSVCKGKKGDLQRGDTRNKDKHKNKFKTANDTTQNPVKVHPPARGPRLCYNCNSPDHIANECPTKQARVNRVQMDEVAPGPDEEAAHHLHLRGWEYPPDNFSVQRIRFVGNVDVHDVFECGSDSDHIPALVSDSDTDTDRAYDVDHHSDSDSDSDSLPELINSSDDEDSDWSDYDCDSDSDSLPELTDSSDDEESDWWAEEDSSDDEAELADVRHAYDICVDFDTVELVVRATDLVQSASYSSALPRTMHETATHHSSPPPRALAPQHVRMVSSDGTDSVIVPCIINERKILVQLDSGANCSVIASRMAKEMELQLVPPKGQLILAKGRTRSLGSTHVTITVGDRQPRKIPVQVLDLEGVDFLLGLPHWAPLGFTIEGLPATFPNGGPDADPDTDGGAPGSEENGRDTNPGIGGADQKPTSAFELTDVDEEGSSAGAYSDSLWRQQERMPEPFVAQLMEQVAPELEQNAAIPPTSLCTHPSAVVRLPMSDDEPVYRRQYPIPHALKPVVDEKVAEWRSHGTITRAPAASPWNSPLLVASKKDADGRKSAHRVCIDPRAINTKLKDSAAMIPLILALFTLLSGFVVCSALDLQNSYHQFPLHPSDRLKTTFTWNNLRWMFVGAPFGLKPLTSLFQSAMQTMLESCAAFVVIFVDDILVYSKDAGLHATHCKRVLQILNKWCLRLRLSKCHWGYTQLIVLGHVLTGKGRLPDPRKVAQLHDWPVPTTGKQVMALLGMINYLRDYIPLYSSIAAPLETLRKLKDVASVWSADGKYQAAFDLFKKVLSKAPTVEFPKADVLIQVATDASQCGIGAVAFQDYDGSRHYLMFVSKALRKAQLNYSATKRELLAIVFCLQRMRQLLYGIHFRLHTDHRALTFVFTTERISYAIHEWIDVIFDFDFEIVHAPGILNVLPDALSRLYPSRFWKGGCGPLQDSKRAQHQAVRRLLLTDVVKYPDKELAHFISERMDKECPAAGQRQKLLEQAHVQGHFGADYVFKKLWAAGYYWPQMKKECIEFVAACMPCARYNVGKRGFHPLRSIHAMFPFDHLAMDLADLPTSTSGCNFLLVVVDLATMFCLLRAIPDKTALTVARCMWSIFCNFGVCKIIQSDNGSEFVNEVISTLVSVCGIDHRLVACYNPRANGAAEKTVGIAKLCVLKAADGDIGHWDLYVPGTQLSINSKVSAAGSPPHSLMFGRPAIPLVDYAGAQSRLLSVEKIRDMHASVRAVVHPEVFASNEQRKKAASARYNKRTTAKKFPVGATVMIRDVLRASKMEPRWVGPYTIAKRTKHGTFSLLDQQNALLGRNVPVDQMKLVALPKSNVSLQALPSQASTPQVEAAAAAVTYTVERILRHRGRANARQYLVSWLGYPDSHNSWEPESNFVDRSVIIDYWKGVPRPKTKKAKR
jgi:hypothetical protein